jgi:hypothetical protein
MSYELVVGSQSFYAIIEKKSSHNSNVIVGGRNKGCVIIEITKYSKGIQEGVLNVSYDHECNTSGTMVNGAGTVTMIKAAIQFTFAHFDKVKAIYIHDHSHVKCDELDLYLPPIELAKYGKTWYERHLGAELEDPRSKPYIDKYINLCQTNQDWNNFSEIVMPILRRNIRRKIIKENTATILEQSFKHHNGNLRNMIRSMKETHGCKLFLVWLELYFSTIISPIPFKDIDYVVHRDSYTELMMTIKVLHTNPYAEDILQRTKNVNSRMNIFSSFIPRSHISIVSFMILDSKPKKTT